MLNNNFNFHTPWDSQNPYNPRLNHKQALWGGQKKNNINQIHVRISNIQSKIKFRKNFHFAIPKFINKYW
jgi:hypothetical protein